MDYQTAFLVFFLFIMKDMFTTQSIRATSEYDITTFLADWIPKIFENNDEMDTKIDDSIKAAFASAEHHRLEEFEFNLTHPVGIFESEVKFFDVNFYTHSEDAEETKPFSVVKQKLSDNNKISISTPFLRITLESELHQTKDQTYASCFTTLHFDNFVLNGIQISKDSEDAKFAFDFSYEKYYVWHHGSEVKIKFPEGELSNDHKDELTNEIQAVLPRLLLLHINRNPEFSKAFDEIFKIYLQPSETISSHPDFSNHRDLYYYFIPEVPFYGFYLRNVVMQGLANVGSLDIDKKSAIFTHNLMVKNVRGSMTLDYGCEKETPLELNYLISYLTISINENNDFVHVEAKGCSVNRTNGDSLTYLQSAIIMEKIESAVASSLMPTKKAWKSFNMESEIDQIEHTNTSDWETIKQSYRNWIPFNEPKILNKPWIVQRIF